MVRTLSSQDPGAAAGEIKEILRSMGVSPYNIQLNIPKHLVTVRFLKIPSVEDQEINKIIKMESVRHLPYAEENVIYGYRVIEKLPDGYSRVLLAIAHADVINNMVDILNRVQIGGLKFLSLSSEALFLWYSIAKEGGENENIMLINLDPDHIDIDVIEGGKLVFTRGVSYGARDPKKLSNISSEINISISTYEKESSKRISRVLLTGGKNEAENCKSVLVKELKLPVEIIDQTRNMPIDESAGIPEKDVSFAELFGLSLESEDVKINLLPANTREEARLAMLKNNLATTMLLFTVFVILVFGLFVKKICDKSAYLAGVKAELRKIEPGVSSTKKMMKDINIIKDMMAKRPLAVEIVSELYTVSTGDISLNTVNFESGKMIAVKGASQSLSGVLKYVDALEGSPYFEGVRVKYANKRMVEGKEIVDFEVDSSLSRLK